MESIYHRVPLLCMPIFADQPDNAARLVERELQLSEQKREAETFLRELQESVECPVCFSIPRAPPVPCCQNGHVICGKCKEKVEVRNISSGQSALVRSVMMQ